MPWYEWCFWSGRARGFQPELWCGIRVQSVGSVVSNGLCRWCLLMCLPSSWGKSGSPVLVSGKSWGFVDSWLVATTFRWTGAGHPLKVLGVLVVAGGGNIAGAGAGADTDTNGERRPRGSLCPRTAARHRRRLCVADIDVRTVGMGTPQGVLYCASFCRTRLVLVRVLLRSFHAPLRGLGRKPKQTVLSL